MKTRQINKLLKEATAEGKNLYAQNLQVNTLGMIDETWRRVFAAKTLYGETHCKVIGQPAWAKVITTTKFDAR